MFTNYNDAVKQFSYLWLTNDKEWVDNRKKEWRYIAENHLDDGFSSSERKQLLRYFIFAERDSYITPTMQYFLTPFNKSLEAKKIFISEMFGETEREYIYSCFLDSASIYGNGLPWIRGHCLNFIEGVLGNSYQPPTPNDTDSKNYKSRFSPSSFSKNVFVKICLVLRLKHTMDYHGYVDGIDYFVSCLPYVTNNKCRKRMRWAELFELVDETLKNTDVRPSLAVEFAEKINEKRSQIEEAWAINSDLD